MATSLIFYNAHEASRRTDYVHRGDDVSPLMHYWTLSLEEQFYLL